MNAPSDLALPIVLASGLARAERSMRIRAIHFVADR
jgi:hypothetical protein